jgi:hypothetical protein
MNADSKKRTPAPETPGDDDFCGTNPIWRDRGGRGDDGFPGGVSWRMHKAELPGQRFADRSQFSISYLNLLGLGGNVEGCDDSSFVQNCARVCKKAQASLSAYMAPQASQGRTAHVCLSTFRLACESAAY